MRFEAKINNVKQCLKCEVPGCLKCTTRPPTAAATGTTPTGMPDVVCEEKSCKPGFTWA